MYIWYCPDDGICEVHGTNPCEYVNTWRRPSESVFMIPPEVWECE